MNEICVCAEPLVERGLYPCGHALCLSCTLKHRVLMKDLHCPYCRMNAGEVAVLSGADSKFEDAKIDFRRGHLRVENDDVKAKLRHILQYPCPECDEDQHDLKKLKRHLADQHDKAVCDVCVKNEFNFSDEYITYKAGKIKEHLKKRHIFCKYCRQYFYGTTDFAAHCKKEHVSCDICERRDPEHPQYFEHYTQLRNHYQENHYRCMETECLANMHIVFGTAVELQKHMVEAHNMTPQSVSVDFQHVKPPKAAKANAEKAAEEPEKENDEARYSARLEIVAEHDQSKIAKIRGANSTFLSKKVPVEVFIATYESVLKKGAEFAPQITALLTTFAKAHGAEMTPANLRALNFKLYMRDQADQKHAEAEKEQKILSTGSYAQQSGSGGSSKQKNSRGPSPVPIAPINWGLNLPRAGGLGSNLQSLPKLGGSRPTASVSREPNLNRSHRVNLNGGSGESTAGSYASLSRPAVTLQNLPKLERKTAPTTPSMAGPSANSPAISLSQSHSMSLNRPMESQSLGQNQSRGLQLNNLPSLPKAKKKEEKKRQHNVIRIK